MLILLVFVVFGFGCSCSNAHYSYNVELGHPGPNNSPAEPASTNDASCCSGLRSDLHKLELVLTAAGLMVENNQTNQTMEQMREYEYNKTYILMKSMLQNARDENTKLRGDLATTTRDLNNCKGNLNLQTGSGKTTISVSNNNVNMTFCDFESLERYCGFDASITGTFGWKSHSGRITSLTGPIEDHTYGSPHGQYMYMAASENFQSTNTTHVYHMESGKFQPSSEVCIRFWYNMRGKDIKTLNIYAKVGKGNGYPIWSVTGDQGTDWHMGEVDLDTDYSSTPFQIVVEGTADSYFLTNNSVHYYNWQADIAFDDLYVYSTACTKIPTCPPGSVKTTIKNYTSCYTFHLASSDWYTAVAACRMEGAHSSLVSITSQQEQQFLMDHISSDTVLNGASGFYTSGNDERSEGHFDWTDTGTPYQATYTNWHTGQPNNAGNNQNCLMLEVNKLEWRDEPCTSKHSFICEARYPI